MKEILSVFAGLLVLLAIGTATIAQASEEWFTLYSIDGKEVLARAKVEWLAGETAKQKWNRHDCVAGVTLLTIMARDESAIGYSTKCDGMSQVDIASAIRFQLDRVRGSEKSATTIPTKPCYDAVELKNGVMTFGCFGPKGEMIGREFSRKLSQIPIQYDAVYRSPEVVSAATTMLEYSQKCASRDIKSCTSIRLISHRLERALEIEARLMGLLLK